MTGSLYDRIGSGYVQFRRPDPRLAKEIDHALGDTRSVINVGAGTGSYEPQTRQVFAVEPSRIMIEQRPTSAAPAVQAQAERLPFGDDAADAALAVFTMHHWSDIQRGLTEMLRVASRRLVIVTMEPAIFASGWLVTEYLPEAVAVHASAFPSIQGLLGTLPRSTSIPWPVPADCADGFMAAFWARPEAYLDPGVRSASSPWQQLPRPAVDRALTALADDLTRGEWDRRHPGLRSRKALDMGVRLLCSQIA